MITRTVEEFVEDLLALAKEHRIKPLQGKETVGELAQRILAPGISWREIFGTALTAEIDWWEATPYVGLESVWNAETEEFENPPRVEKDPP